MSSIETGSALAALPSKQRLTFIDGLRAVAILLVFVRHSTEMFVLSGHGTRLLFKLTGWLDFGALGVIIFFAISGFLIPSSLHGAKLPGSVRYMLSRAFRLYPAFIVSVVPSYLTHYRMAGAPFTRVDLMLNFTMVPRLFGGTLANGAYWTLEVEVAFYLLCLLLFVGGVIERNFVFAAVTLVTFAIFESSQQPFFDGLFNPPLSGQAFFFCLNISVMCWGAMFRSWWSGRRLNIATAVVFWGFAAFWILYRPALLLIAASQDRLGDVDPNITVPYGLGLGIFFAVAIYGRVGSALMLWVGRISYSFYLLHGVAIHLIQRELERHASLRGYYAGLYSLLALALSLLLAHLSFTYVERPGIRLGRRLIAVSLRVLGTWQGAPVWLVRAISPLLARPASSHPAPSHPAPLRQSPVHTARATDSVA